MPSGLDASQLAVVARQTYDEQLTSTRYRGWLYRLTDAVRAGNDAVRASMVDTLAADAKAAGKSRCWFVDTLRQ